MKISNGRAIALWLLLIAQSPVARAAPPIRPRIPLDAAPSCTLPVGGLYATFAVGSDIYQQHITSTKGIQGALDLWNGVSRAAIPIGKLTCSSTAWNCPWSWHVEPDSIQFGEFAIEVCDAAPSYLEANCSRFVTTYCPWGARLIDLRDCRTNASCPTVPREKASE